MQLKLHHSCTGHRAALYALARGKNARQVYSAGGDGWIVEWNIDEPETGRVVATVETQVFSLLSFPEASRLVAGNMNGGLHWIDLQAPDKTRNIQHHQKGVFDLKTYNQWLFSAGGDGVLTRWATEEARAVESFQISAKALRRLAISVARQELAVGSSDGFIYFLDLETLALKDRIPNAHEPSVFSLSYTPHERFLVSGGRDAMLRVWDLGQNKNLHTELPAHLFTINHIAYAPGGEIFATASRDKTIRIWRSRDFELLKVLEPIRDNGHLNSVNYLHWSGENLLVSCSDDRTMKLWDVQDTSYASSN